MMALMLSRTLPLERVTELEEVMEEMMGTEAEGGEEVSAKIASTRRLPSSSRRKDDSLIFPDSSKGIKTSEMVGTDETMVGYGLKFHSSFGVKVVIALVPRNEAKSALPNLLILVSATEHSQDSKKPVLEEAGRVGSNQIERIA